VLLLDQFPEQALPFFSHFYAIPLPLLFPAFGGLHIRGGILDCTAYHYTGRRANHHSAG
jgi:hypothetical protein